MPYYVVASFIGKRMSDGYDYKLFYENGLK